MKRDMFLASADDGRHDKEIVVDFVVHGARKLHERKRSSGGDWDMVKLVDVSSLRPFLAGLDRHAGGRDGVVDVNEANSLARASRR